MNGFLNVLKPPGMSSHDVVAHIRRITRAKTGHTGTLDPAAAGVLVLVLGKATRLASFVSESIKSYRGELKLGEATDTGDSEGRIISQKPVPDFGEKELTGLFSEFTGSLEQKPPMYSAVRHEGQRLYRLARQGLDVERPSRNITIHTLTLAGVKGKRILFDVTCSKGTYIRVLCADLARALGTVGHMSFLIRTASGPFTLENTTTLEELREGNGSAVKSALSPLDYPLGLLPKITLDESQALRISHGNSLSLLESRELPLPDKGTVRIYGHEGFMALGTVNRGQGEGQILLKPTMVLI